LFSVFALVERKNRKQAKKKSTALPQANNANCISAAQGFGQVHPQE
jgi:hypothetical protein